MIEFIFEDCVEIQIIAFRRWDETGEREREGDVISAQVRARVSGTRELALLPLRQTLVGN